MATQICNILAVNIDGINSGAPAGSRTYTTTRSLRLMDLKGIVGANPGAAITYTVSTPGGVCITKVTGPGVGERDVVRLGDNSNDRRDDSTALASAGQNIVFTSDQAVDTRLTLYCWTLG